MTVMTDARIGPAEAARRAEDAQRIRHSTEMEGGRTTPKARAIQDAFVRGEIDADELIRRTRAYLDIEQ